MRLIDAEEAYKVLTDYYHQRTEIQHRALKEAIERVHTVDPVKHGHWIAHGKSIIGIPVERCSECAEWSCGFNQKYCPKCGAKMDEQET